MTILETQLRDIQDTIQGKLKVIDDLTHATGGWRSKADAARLSTAHTIDLQNLRIEEANLLQQLKNNMSNAANTDIIQASRISGNVNQINPLVLAVGAVALILILK